MRKTIIFFMRHGEVYNPKGILYGRLLRFPLSVEGRKKVQEQSYKFQKEGIDVIYTSPLLRTRQTAAIIGEKLGLKPKISKLLLEVRLIIEGMSLSQFRRTIQPNIYDEQYTKKGQESIEEIVARMTRFTQMILKKHQGKKILVISHGDPIVILKAYYLGIPFTYKYKKDNYLSTGNFIKLTASDGKFDWN